MNNLSKILAIGFGFGILAMLLSLIPNHPAGAASGPPPTSVNVLNTPLPIAGSVNAAVTGTVGATQSGVWNVGITGTPNVEVTSLPPLTLSAGSVGVSNTPTNAIPVVQAPVGTNIYNNECTGTAEAGQGGNAGCVFPPIQTGMVLYVESASIQTYSTTGTDPQVAGITEGLTAPPHFIPMIAQQPSSVSDSYVGQMVGTAHLPAGTPGCEVFTGGTGRVSLTCTLFGYLVPAS
jgi:hypothetical protein